MAYLLPFLALFLLFADLVHAQYQCASNSEFICDGIRVQDSKAIKDYCDFDKSTKIYCKLTVKRKSTEDIWSVAPDGDPFYTDTDQRPNWECTDDNKKRRNILAVICTSSQCSDGQTIERVLKACNVPTAKCGGELIYPSQEDEQQKKYLACAFKLSYSADGWFKLGTGEKASLLDFNISSNGTAMCDNSTNTIYCNQDDCDTLFTHDRLPEYCGDVEFSIPAHFSTEDDSESMKEIKKILWSPLNIGLLALFILLFLVAVGVGMPWRWWKRLCRRNDKVHPVMVMKTNKGSEILSRPETAAHPPVKQIPRETTMQSSTMNEISNSQRSDSKTITEQSTISRWRPGQTPKHFSKVAERTSSAPPTPKPSRPRTKKPKRNRIRLLPKSPLHRLTPKVAVPAKKEAEPVVNSQSVSPPTDVFTPEVDDKTQPSSASKRSSRPKRAPGK